MNRRPVATGKEYSMAGGIIAFGCVALIAWCFFIPFVVMVAWNAFAVPVFNAPVVNYWEAFAGLFLFNILTAGVQGIFRKS